MSASLSASETPSDKSKIRSSELAPRKLCLKFNPPSLALYYTLTSSPSKKFLHTVNISKEITSEIPAPEIYKKLLEREPGYWNPKAVGKKQVLKLIDKLLERQVEKRTTPKADELSKESTANDKNSSTKQLSIESAVYCNPVLATNIEEASSSSMNQPMDINSENIAINPTAPTKFEESAPDEKQADRKEIITEELNVAMPKEDEEPTKPTESKKELAEKAIEEYNNREESESNEELNKGELDFEENEEEMQKMMGEKDMQKVYEEMLIRKALIGNAKYRTWRKTSRRRC